MRFANGRGLNCYFMIDKSASDPFTFSLNSFIMSLLNVQTAKVRIQEVL